MIKVKTKPVYDEKGKKVGIVLSIKNYEKLIERLEDMYDYDYVKNMGPIKKTYTQEEVDKILGL